MRLCCPAAPTTHTTASNQAPQTRGIHFMSVPLSKLPESIHYRLRQMMRPGGCVVMRPESSVDLRDNYLHIRWSKLVDLFAQQSRRIQAMRAKINFPPRIAGYQLIAIYCVFQLLRIAGH